jgi:hypothetical protein
VHAVLAGKEVHVTNEKSALESRWAAVYDRAVDRGDAIIKEVSALAAEYAHDFERRRPGEAVRKVEEAEALVARASPMRSSAVMQSFARSMARSLLEPRSAT